MGEADGVVDARQEEGGVVLDAQGQVTAVGLGSVQWRQKCDGEDG